MAKNRESEEKIRRPEPVRYDEEDTSEDEEFQESGSDSDESQPSKESPALPLKVSSESSSEEESGSDTESEERPQIVTPSAQKPVQNPIVKKTPAKVITSLSEKPAAPSGQKAVGVKRLSEKKGGSEAKHVKKAKKSEASNSQDPKTPEIQPEPSTDTKKQLFQRIWSADDEIVILEGMIEFMEEKNADPSSRLDSFHASIKEKLHIDVTRGQLQDKIRRLRKRYENSKKRAVEGGDPVFSEPHKVKSYELSKMIWGRPKSNVPAVKNTPMKKDNDDNPSELDSSDIPKPVDFPIPRHGPCLNRWTMVEHDRVLMMGSEIFEGEKTVEGAKEWQRLRLEETKTHLKKLNIMAQQTKLLLHALEEPDMA